MLKATDSLGCKYYLVACYSFLFLIVLHDVINFVLVPLFFCHLLAMTVGCVYSKGNRVL
jgi:hypothetical protein